MGVLQEFERRLEGAVEGFFARAFRSGIQPVELAKALQRYAKDEQRVAADGVVVPNVFRVVVGPRDHERLAGYGASLPRELGEVVLRTAAERGWTLRGPVKVRVLVEEDIPFGRFRLMGRVEHADVGAMSAPDDPRGKVERTVPAPRDAAGTDDARDAADDAGLHGTIDRTQVITSAPTARLIAVLASGPDAGRRTPLVGSRLTLGRSTACDLVVPETTVSREHAAFVLRGDVWWVVDLDSTNGVRVNGRQTVEHPVERGDRVTLGDAVVELVEG